MIQEAQAVVKNRNTSLQLLGVTVLTSDSTEQAHRVKELAQIAVAADISGIVCSPHEVVALSQEPFKKLKKVTPGIRPEFFKSATDHQRFTTPAEAVRNGSDFLVVGRPITLSNDPRESCQKVLEEIYESCR
jgi:orotidine-5'-phosphate decarboxylase